MRAFFCAAISTLTLLFLFTQRASAQNTPALQYQFQPNQALRYRLELQQSFRLTGGAAGQDLPVTTRTTFQAVVRLVEVAPGGVATLEARVEEFSVRTTIGSKETVSPTSAARDQTTKFRIGPSGPTAGQETPAAAPGVPWDLFLSQVFPDLSLCRPLGPAAVNGKPCVRIGVSVVTAPAERPENGGAAQGRDYSRGEGDAFFAEGHLVSGETRGTTDLEYNIFLPEDRSGPAKVSVKGTFQSRLSLLP